MQGVVVQTRGDGPDGQQYFILPPERASFLMQKGVIDETDICLQTIEDKSKANSFNKAVAAVQIAWFLSQLCGRTATHLPITLLEFFTLAYLVCAVAAYAFWWHKPFDIQQAIIVTATGPIGDWREFTRPRTLDRMFRTRSVENQFFHDARGQRGFLAFLVVCIAFGSCHLLGWDAHFATSTERTLWRIGSICCIGLPLSSCLFPGVVYSAKGANKTFSSIVVDWASILLGCGVVVIYSAVRIFLLFESFFSLRDVPAGVYRAVPWAQYIPHI
jgi:hypothetical protein